MATKAPKHRADAPAPCVDITTNGPVLVLGGDLDVRSTAEVRAAVHEHLHVHGDDLEERVVIDIGKVGSVDATALRMLAAASWLAHGYGLRVVLRGPRPAVRRMLHLTHLIRLVEVEREQVPA